DRASVHAPEEERGRILTALIEVHDLGAVPDDRDGGAARIAALRKRWFEELIALHVGRGRAETALHTTLQALEELAPEESFWEGAEALARELGSPGGVAELYARKIDQARTPDEVRWLGERAVAFHEEWFDD